MKSPISPSLERRRGSWEANDDFRFWIESGIFKFKMAGVGGQLRTEVGCEKILGALLTVLLFHESVDAAVASDLPSRRICP
jgi:hypothetical protein